MASSADPTSLLMPGRVLLAVAAAVVGVAMLPCLGFLNWVMIPLALVPGGLGVLGLWRCRRADPALRLQPAPFLGLAIGGAALALASTVRLLLGGGVL